MAESGELAGRLSEILGLERMPVAVAACPLGEAPYEPDVVVMEAQPEQLMWVALAWVRRRGGRLDFSTAIPSGHVRGQHYPALHLGQAERRAGLLWLP